MSHTKNDRTIKLVTVSVLTLFLEVALIRWVSTEIRIFAYVNNLVLLACFLGVGIGCYFANRQANMAATLIGLTALLGLITAPLSIPIAGMRVHPFRDTPTMLSVFSDFLVWFQEQPTHLAAKVLAGLTATLLIFFIILAVFIPLGRLLGGLFREHDNLVAAYSVNVAASLVGIWVFNGLSWLSLPPWVWFAIAWVMIGLLIGRTTIERLGLCGLFLAVVAMAIYPARMPTVLWDPYRTQDKAVMTLWSPYQKLQVIPSQQGVYKAYTVTVNNVGYMNILDLSNRGLEMLPIFVNRGWRAFSQYDVPYRFYDGVPQQVLIVGAGAGNDAAGALRNGASHVTAVEIDPGIYRLGKAFHPEAPYASSRVEMVIDDARAFLKRTNKRFDLISFGLLDAHAQASAYNNIRLDHYVYTEESFTEAKALLKEEGVLTVVFEAGHSYITDRIRGVLQQAFGTEPIVFRLWSDGWFGPGGVMFVISKDMTRLHQMIDRQPMLRQLIDSATIERRYKVRLTTDDWPYLYVEKPRIPTLHLCLSGILLVLLFLLRSRLIPSGKSLEWHFFWLGAAFLLLEFQNISKTTLLFGSTWMVNAFTISAILVLILLANFISGHRPSINSRMLYLSLLMTIVVLYWLPLRTLNVLPSFSRGIVASLLLNLPIFFAGMIFIASFRRTNDPSLALGSNLLGASIGGLLESLSFVTGVHFLLVLVAVLYGASFLCLGQQT